METVKFKDPVIMVVKSIIMVQPGTAETAEQRSTDCRPSVSSGGTPGILMGSPDSGKV